MNPQIDGRPCGGLGGQDHAQHGHPPRQHAHGQPLEPGVGPPGRTDAAQPADSEDHGPGQAGREDQQPVGGGGRDALPGSESGGGEGPGGYAFAGAPAADVGGHGHRDQREQRQWQQLDRGRAHPDGPGGHDVGRHMPGHHH